MLRSTRGRTTTREGRDARDDDGAGRGGRRQRRTRDRRRAARSAPPPARRGPAPRAGRDRRSGGARPPLAIGERLEYGVRVGGMGTIGTGVMWIEGPVEVRGRDVWLL